MSDALPVQVVYAGFWRRAAATLTDDALLCALLLALVHLAGQPGLLLRPGPVSALFAGLLGLVYAAGFESSRWQATPGKRLLAIKVTDLAGRRIGVWPAVLRRVMQLASALCLMLGYLMCVFTQRRQCLHDLFADTLVVRAACTTQQIGQAPLARAWSPWQIAALVAPVLALWFALLLHLPQVARYDADALPEPDHYQARTQVAAALYYAGDAMDMAETLYGEHRDFAEVNVQEVDLDDEASRTIAALAIVAGSIRITFGGEADAVLQGHTATLTPALDEDGNLAWVCGYADVPEGYAAVHDDYRKLTDILPAALPPDCLAEGADDSAEDAAPPGLRA